MIVQTGFWVRVDGKLGHICGTSQSVQSQETEAIKICFKPHKDSLGFDGNHLAIKVPFAGVTFLGPLIPEPFDPFEESKKCTCTPCNLHPDN